jgi:predicted NAD/FAD-binding protein
MTEREDRILANEILFREVNERVDDLAERTATLAVLDYVCECGQPTCTGKITLTHEQYQAVRSDGQRFVTLPDHQTTELERVVERHDDYQIVEKVDSEAAQRAEEADPR